jgi:hypothetical protein
MEWAQVFESVGVPAAMLVYFVWHSNQRDKEMSEERAKHSAMFKQARESHIQAEMDSLLKYAELTKQVTAVISTVQQEINVLTDKVAELAAIIRSQK